MERSVRDCGVNCGRLMLQRMTPSVPQSKVRWLLLCLLFGCPLPWRCSPWRCSRFSVVACPVAGSTKSLDQIGGDLPPKDPAIFADDVRNRKLEHILSTTSRQNGVGVRKECRIQAGEGGGDGAAQRAPRSGRDERVYI